MKPASLITLVYGTLVSGQATYPNIPARFLHTLEPITALPGGFPWGPRTASNTNPYVDPPNTGVIRKYDFTVSRGTAAPDGYSKNALLINGQFPGPLLEANWGDTIQVTLHNQITGPQEGVALHWHGMLQKGTPWMDGVPAISQCPIPYGQSFTYSFTADLYGTSWYHSHYSAQYSGGLLGPMIIHGPSTLPYDIDVGPVLLTDYYHRDYFTVMKDVMGTVPAKVPAFSDNNLINGRNNFDCSKVAAGDNTPCESNAGISSFKFTPGKTHLLRLINAGSEGMQKFSLDDHNMTVIANDFVPIIPYTTQVVSLGIAQRTDVLIYAPANASGSYTMRSSIAVYPCSFAHQPDATAIVYYGTSPETCTSTPWPAWVDSIANSCQNDPVDQTVPWFPITPDPAPPVTQLVTIGLTTNSTGHTIWTMNNVAFRGDYNAPILLLSNSGNNSYPFDPEWNVYNFGSSSSVRFVINNPTGFPHPIHLHGHNFFVLAAGAPGDGNFPDGALTNPKNPQRRDVQVVAPNSYIVIQLTADNPGAWPLHCHIAWHVSAGLFLTVLERPDDIKNLKIPSIMAQTCREWSAFTNTTIPNQIDSGL
ncbi:Cupredoxin [Hyaloscypha finlandica]|nr:Cupredoxin [Hyaloscypha finlandica]